MVHKLFLILLSLIYSLLLFSQQEYSQKSLLMSGRWHKICIHDEGFYKISYSELKKMGYNDPMKVSVHGYGGWLLDEDFTKPYVDDLPAVKVLRGSDYLLFYAKGTRKWEYDYTGQTFKHTNNYYSNYGCYFISDLGVSGEMATEPILEGSFLRIDTFDDYLLHEEDLVSVNQSGRDLFGESILGSSLEIPIKSIEGITDEDGIVEYRAISKVRNGRRNTINLIVNGEPMSCDVPSLTEYEEKHFLDYIKAKPINPSFKWVGDKEEKMNVSVFCSDGSNRTSYLDWVKFQFKRKLIMYSDSCMFFRSISSLNNRSKFVIENVGDNSIVFDVTDSFMPKIMQTKKEKNALFFTIPSGKTLREFALLKTSRDIRVEDVVEITNQNLHGSPSGDLIIISPVNFKEEAKRLLDIHKKHDGLDGIVVTPEEIYNEFSSGTPDATAYRRFIKMLYDRGISGTGKTPRYLLLFGDGTYDNRFLTKEWKTYSKVSRENLLLTYQTKESLNMYSYVTDDYFGLMDNNEGIDNSALVNIGIGRLPVRTKEQAESVVDKIISYIEDDKPGFWKNSLCFLADDGSNGDGFSTAHESNADKVASLIDANRPEYVCNKIYFDSYKKYTTYLPYPDVNKAIQKQLNEGVLVLGYVGHGGTDALSDERVITHNDILGYKYEHLPLWITTTCDFCRFDDAQTSAGEDVLLNQKSGGIALFTTARVSFIDINEKVNHNLINNLLVDKNYKSNRLGDMIRDMKCSTTDNRKLGFCLVGDPALRLSYPQYSINVTSINGKPVQDSVVQFKALEKITISGCVQDDLKDTQENFFGQLEVLVLDGQTNIETQGNNGEKFSYNDYVNTIYKGNTVVSNGRFNFSFIVPKDISYSTTNKGKMSLYAFDKTVNIDAQGYYDNFVVSGTSETPNIDDEAPEIRSIFFNDSTFVDGGKVNNTPYFYVRLWDKSGINITGNSIGHDITLYVDGNPVRNYNLNDYYRNIPDKQGEGEVGFSVPKLESGLHYAEFKVWDVMNNVRTDTITFEVVEGLKPFICDLKVFPNPARESAQFYFSHNRPESRMDVEIAVYDMAGRLQWKHKEQGSSDFFNGYTVSWDLRGFGGSKLRPGVYLYRASISTDNSKDATEAEKMIVLY